MPETRFLRLVLFPVPARSVAGVQNYIFDLAYDNWLIESIRPVLLYRINSISSSFLIPRCA